MKRYLSVFEMIARSSIYKVLLILVGMVAVEAAFFYSTMMHPEGLNIESYIDQSYYSIIFKIAYILVTLVIVLPGMNIGSTQSYTLERLRIKGKRIFWLQALYNTLAYMLLWGVQLMVILVSAKMFEKNLPLTAEWSHQTLFLAFYRNDFMHSILPLEDGPGWWLLGIVIIGTAIVTAGFTKQQRDGKFAFELLLMVVAVLISFPRAISYEYLFLIIATVFVIVIMGMRWLLNLEVNES